MVKNLPLLVIPAPAFAGVNLSPRKRGAGIYAFGIYWIPACAGMTTLRHWWKSIFIVRACLRLPAAGREFGF